MKQPTSYEGPSLHCSVDVPLSLEGRREKWKVVPTEEVTFGLGEIMGLDRPLGKSCGLPGTSLVFRRVSWVCASGHTETTECLFMADMSDLQQ